MGAQKQLGSSGEVSLRDHDVDRYLPGLRPRLRQCTNRSSVKLQATSERETPVIRGTTTLIAHLGYPTEAFKAPMIYNPYFE